MIGKCRCAALRIIIEGLTPPPVYACHCWSCQAANLRDFTLYVLLPLRNLIVEGDAKQISSGDVAQYSCDRCGAAVFRHYRTLPGLVVLHASAIESSISLQPVAHVWTKHKRSGVVLPDDVPSWTEFPSLSALVDALGIIVAYGGAGDEVWTREGREAFSPSTETTFCSSSTGLARHSNVPRPVPSR